MVLSDNLTLHCSLQILGPFFIGGPLDDHVITLRNARGAEERVIIALVAVPQDMPQVELAKQHVC